MVHFGTIEALGVRVAAMSDRSDGDCSDGIAQKDVCRRCGVDPEHLVLGHQVHGAGIASVGLSDRGRGNGTRAKVPDSDALICGDKGVPVGVLVADCVPLYLVDPGRHVIAIVHAGRKGTFAHIAGKVVERLHTEFFVEPSDLHALIGPSAGPDAYEVSIELADEFRTAGLPVSGRIVDLWGANRKQLERAGVLSENIETFGVCTILDGRFHSHRRYADSGRNLALLMM